MTTSSNGQIMSCWVSEEESEGGSAFPLKITCIKELVQKHQLLKMRCYQLLLTLCALTLKYGALTDLSDLCILLII